MVADDYFEFRSRVGSALFSLGALADEVRVSPSPAPTINALVASLKDPFVFLVAGEVNAGKSMLLNALFGAEFCQTSALPSTDKICYFRHGFARQEMELTETLREVRLPHAFLHDFHIVDSPGVNSLAEGHQAVTEQFLPRADVVLYVFPATNPWGAQAWDFLGRIHADWRKKVVLVLQQIDLRTDEEIVAIVEHMHFWTQKRFQHVFPVFPVSARRALLARTSGVDKERLLAESRFAALEGHLSHIVAGSAPRLEKLRNTVRMGQILLQQVGAKLAQQSSALAREGDVLLGISHALADAETRTRHRCQPAIDAITNDRRMALIACETQIRVRSGLAASVADLFRPSPLPEKVLRSLQVSLTDSVRRHGETAWQIAEDDMAAFWEQAHPEMDRALGAGGTKNSRFAESPERREEMLSLLEKAARQHVRETQGAELLLPLLGARRRWLAIAMALTLTFFAGAWAVWHFAGSMNGAAALACGGALALAFAAVACRKFSRRCGEAFSAQGERHAADFRERMLGALAQGLRRRVMDVAAAFRPLQEMCERHRSLHEPKIKEAEALKQNFGQMAGILG